MPCVFALPTGILCAGFIEEIQKTKKKKVCPHCGKDIDNIYIDIKKDE